MRRFVAAALVAFGLISGGAATAQAQGALCHHASQTYSPGSMMRMGNVLMLCAVTEELVGTWVNIADDAGSANCSSSGREFGEGSITNVGGIDLVCRSGAWFTKK